MKRLQTTASDSGNDIANVHKKICVLARCVFLQQETL